VRKWNALFLGNWLMYGAFCQGLTSTSMFPAQLRTYIFDLIGRDFRSQLIDCQFKRQTFSRTERFQWVVRFVFYSWCDCFLRAAWLVKNLHHYRLVTRQRYSDLWMMTRHFASYSLSNIHRLHWTLLRSPQNQSSHRCHPINTGFMICQGAVY